MNRRNFLQSVSSAALVAAMPVPILAATIPTIRVSDVDYVWLDADCITATNISMNDIDRFLQLAPEISFMPCPLI